MHVVPGISEQATILSREGRYRHLGLRVLSTKDSISDRSQIPIAVGIISPEAQTKLSDVTRQSFFEGIKFAKGWAIISMISLPQSRPYAESFGYGVVLRSWLATVIGTTHLHEEPEVAELLHRSARAIQTGVPGRTLAVEPTDQQRNPECSPGWMNDWTVVTKAPQSVCSLREHHPH